MRRYNELFLKSAGASLLIALGDFALLKLGNPIGPIIFSFGLLGVCYMGLNLFTGKCGFWITDKLKITDLLLILLVNLFAGYLCGVIFAATDPSLVAAASEKVSSWNISMPFFIKSVLCGVIMYIAVFLYRRKTPLGIIFGIPLFIFCGFQHCIANIITMGVATTFHWSIIICIIGNFAGSLLMWQLSRGLEEKSTKEEKLTKEEKSTKKEKLMRKEKSTKKA